MSKMPYACVACLLVAILFCVAPGCRGLKFFPAGPDKSDTPSPKEVNTTSVPGVTKPCKYSVRIAPYVFLSDFELKRDLPLFTELAGLRDQVYKELQLPSTETPVYVYLFDDRERYEAYMQARYPELPKRRAFFIAQPRAMGGEDLLVFTSWGDRVRQDLRHELTHALLHSVLKDVPIWLDEGLAEYFELPPDRQGVNEAHLTHIRRSATEPFRPDLARLERLGQVQQMTPGEYREAWAWVHLMLRGAPAAKPILLAYLQQLRTNPTPGALRPRIVPALPAPEESLARHVDRLEAPAVIVPTAQREHATIPRQ